MAKAHGSNSDKYGARTKERAEYWRVSQRTMQKMLAARPPWPVEDVAAMIRRVVALPAASQKKLTKEFRRRIDELRVQQERGGGTKFIADPDYAEFLKTHADAAKADSNILAVLKTRRAFAAYKLELAQARGDLAGVKDATEQLRYISSVIYDEETLAQKLGREIGEQIPKAEFERLVRAVAYWLMRSVDDLLADVCPRLAAASGTGPLFREEVRTIIEPALLSTRVLQPFTRAAQINAGTSLPIWCVASMRSAMESTLEHGVGEFAKLYAAPPPAVAAP